MKIEAIENIERWETFNDLAAKILSIVASDFPKPVILSEGEVLNESLPVNNNQKNTCIDTISKRRHLRSESIKEFVADVFNEALLLVRDQAKAVPNLHGERAADFLKAEELATLEIAQDPRIRNKFFAQKAIAEIGELLPNDFDPSLFLNLGSILRHSGYELKGHLDAMVAQIIRSRLSESVVGVNESVVKQLCKYLTDGAWLSDIERSCKVDPNWLSSKDGLFLSKEGLVVSSPDEVQLLNALTEVEFNNKCRKNNQHTDWSEVERIRKMNFDRQDLEETFRGTRDYLVHAGVLLVKNATSDEGNDLICYTLSAAMVGPLMSAKTSVEGESGFGLFSKLRRLSQLGKPATKELLREGAQVLFTSIAVAGGKIALGSA